MTMTNYPHAFRDLPPVTAVEIRKKYYNIILLLTTQGEDGVSLRRVLGKMRQRKIFHFPQ